MPLAAQRGWYCRQWRHSERDKSLMLCFKILRGLVLLSSDDFFTTLRNRASRGHNFKLFCLTLQLTVTTFLCSSHCQSLEIVIWRSCFGRLIIPLFARRLRSVDLCGFLIGKVSRLFSRGYCCFRLLGSVRHLLVQSFCTVQLCF